MEKVAWKHVYTCTMARDPVSKQEEKEAELCELSGGSS